jgi:hypothetical protein
MSGRPDSHVGSLFHELKGYLGYVSRGLCLYFCCDWAGQIEESGSLGMKGWGEGLGYSEVLRW